MPECGSTQGLMWTYNDQVWVPRGASCGYRMASGSSNGVK